MTALKVTEADFQRLVEGLLDVTGWLHFAVRNSHRTVSARGFPDICAVHPVTGALIFMELKSEKGQATPEQWDWLDALNAGQEQRAILVRPSDFDWLKGWLATRAQKVIT